MADQTEEEKAAAEWAAAAEGGGDGTARVLNQDEIDSLLGFDSSSSKDSENSGLQAIINSALVSYERLPMLEVVFDRLVRMLTTSLRNFTSDNVEVSLDAITSHVSAITSIQFRCPPCSPCSRPSSGTISAC